jgi:hypothetical protein
VNQCPARPLQTLVRWEHCWVQGSAIKQTSELVVGTIYDPVDKACGHCKVARSHESTFRVVGQRIGVSAAERTQLGTGRVPKTSAIVSIRCMRFQVRQPLTSDSLSSFCCHNSVCLCVRSLVDLI